MNSDRVKVVCRRGDSKGAPHNLGRRREVLWLEERGMEREREEREGWEGRGGEGEGKGRRGQEREGKEKERKGSERETVVASGQ